MVNLQQPAPRQLNVPVVSPQHLFLAQPLVNWLKLLPDIQAEFAAEILGVNRAGLKLQDHLADQSLLRRQRQRAP